MRMHVRSYRNPSATEKYRCWTWLIVWLASRNVWAQTNMISNWTCPLTENLTNVYLKRRQLTSSEMQTTAPTRLNHLLPVEVRCDISRVRCLAWSARCNTMSHLTADAVFFRTCLARNTWCDTMSHLTTAAGCINGRPSLPPRPASGTPNRCDFKRRSCSGGLWISKAPKGNRIGSKNWVWF